MEQGSIVLDMLKRLFGNPKNTFDGQTQYVFNCPSASCRKDTNKYNLNFSSERNIFNCFKCHYKGFVVTLIKDFGSADDIEKISLLFPKSQIVKKPKSPFSNFENLKDDITCELPEGYRPLTEKWDSKYYFRAMKYLKSRKITDEMIQKYEIGYTESGPRKFRIIIPSRNVYGNINYYEARTYFTQSKRPLLTYFKPDSPNKLDIIFNVFNINFDLPVYLIEGPFDMLPLINAIPLLGKDLSPLLLSMLVKYKSKVIICLDEDAIDDAIMLYQQLHAYGLDVYFVEVKDDIAKCFEKYGRDGIIETLRNYRKLDFQYLFQLKLKEKKKTVYSTQFLVNEMDKIKQQFKDLMNE